MKRKTLFWALLALCFCTKDLSAQVRAEAGRLTVGGYGEVALIQHRLYMKNGIHGSWCRTTPLWGRGLSRANTGAEERLHDCRARNVIEAIMWHGYSKKSDAYESTEKFYNLPKEDREAVVEFINSI